MRKIIVTGGAGFIGSHICKLLAEHGYDVTAVDDFSHSDGRQLKFCSLVKGDITSPAFLGDLFLSVKPDAIIHLAALSNPLESLKKPQHYYHTNVMGTLHVLNAMVRHGIKNIIFASTSTIYANKDRLEPYRETDECDPAFPYASGKWMGERLIQDYSDAYGIRHALMRLFNPAGADVSGMLGETPKEFSHAVASVVKTALGLAPEFVLYGADYATPDGTSIRDYVHVTDLAHAHLNALRYLETGSPSITANIGSGVGTSLKQLVAMVESQCGSRVNVAFKPRRDIYQSYAVADISRARSILGWNPDHSSLESIVGTTLDWFRQYAEALKERA